MEDSDAIIREYEGKTGTSRKIYGKAVGLLPSGTTRDVLFYRPYPVYARSGKGARIVDVDGNERLDFCYNYSVLLLGHAHPRIVEAIRRQLDNGTVLGQPTELEAQLAETISDFVPCAERVKFTVTGSEAIMNAIRVGRALKSREKIIMFENAYHGTSDSVSVLGGAFSSKGIPTAVSNNTIVLPFNDIDTLERMVEQNHDEIAMIIVEPILGVGGIIPARIEFLKAAREVCQKYDVLLVFDEIVTGFRVSRGGAQEVYGIKPDLVVLGKIIGGGMPLAAVAGIEEVMESAYGHGGALEEKPMIPLSGTYNAHPLSLSAGIATLGELKADVYPQINELGEQLRGDLQGLFRDLRVHAKVTGSHSLFNVHFIEGNIEGSNDLKKSNHKKRHLFDLELLNNGIYLAPGHFCCLSTANTKADVVEFIQIIQKVLQTQPVLATTKAE